MLGCNVVANIICLSPITSFFLRYDGTFESSCENYFSLVKTVSFRRFLFRTFTDIPETQAQIFWGYQQYSVDCWYIYKCFQVKYIQVYFTGCSRRTQTGVAPVLIVHDRRLPFKVACQPKVGQPLWRVLGFTTNNCPGLLSEGKPLLRHGFRV